MQYPAGGSKERRTGQARRLCHLSTPETSTSVPPQCVRDGYRCVIDIPLRSHEYGSWFDLEFECITWYTCGPVSVSHASLMESSLSGALNFVSVV